MRSSRFLSEQLCRRVLCFVMPNFGQYMRECPYAQAGAVQGGRLPQAAVEEWLSICEQECHVRQCKFKGIQMLHVDRMWYTCNVSCLRTGTMRSRGGCLGFSRTGGGVSLSYPRAPPPRPRPTSRRNSQLVSFRLRCRGGSSRCHGVATSRRFWVYGPC